MFALKIIILMAALIVMGWGVSSQLDSALTNTNFFGSVFGVLPFCLIGLLALIGFAKLSDQEDSEKDEKAQDLTKS